MFILSTDFDVENGGWTGTHLNPKQYVSGELCMGHFICSLVLKGITMIELITYKILSMIIADIGAF